MEKIELFELIENEMLIISYMTEKWCGAGESPVTKKEIPKTSERKVTPKSNSNGKETPQKK